MKTEEVKKDRDGRQRFNKWPLTMQDFRDEVRIFLDHELRDRAEAPEKARKGEIDCGR